MINLTSAFLVFVLLPLVLLLCGMWLAGVGSLLLAGGLFRRPAPPPPTGPGDASTAPSATTPRAVSRRNPAMALGGAAVVLVGVLLVIPCVVCGVVITNAVWHDRSVKQSKADANRELQRLLGAERAYRSVNGSFYDPPGCLARPASCIPGYTGPPFLDEVTAALPPRYGFVFSFHPGPAAPAEAVRAGKFSPSSLAGYAFVATFVALPSKKEADDICVDARGLLCLVDGPGAGQGGVCACWAPSAAYPQQIEFRHETGKSPCPQLVGQLQVYNAFERDAVPHDIVTDVRTVGSAPLSFGPNLTLGRREGGAIDVFYTCGAQGSFTAEVIGLKPEDVSPYPDTTPTYPSTVTVRGTIVP